MNTSALLPAALAFIALGSAPALASSNPCKKTSRVTFVGDLGEPTVSAIFTTFERVSKQNHGHREKIRVHKCSLMKLTGTSSWKAASKKLPGAAASNPAVLAEVKKLRQSIPTKATYQSLLDEAKEAKRQFDAMVEVDVPESKSSAYLENIESLRGFVGDLNKGIKHANGMRKKMFVIIQKSGT